MLSVRWRKVLRDLWGNKTRTILVVLSIAVGVFAVGMIATTQSVTGREMQEHYLAVNASDAFIATDLFDEDLVDMVRRMPGVKAAEGRGTFTARVRVGPDAWKTLIIYGIADFNDMRLDLIRPQAGDWPPANREVLVERDALKLTGAQIGDKLLIEMADGKQRELRIGGTAYEFNQFPANLSGRVYVYVTPDTLEWLGFPRDFSVLSIVAEGNEPNRAHVRPVADAVKAKIEKGGRTVYQVYVTNGKYPAADTINAMLQVLAVLGVLAVGLSGFLVINTITAILAQQLRQIGVMKAIGARKGQIMRLYMSLVFIFSVLSLCVAIPLGALGARGLSGFIARVCNYQVLSYRVPPSVWALELGVGLVTPLLAALYPIISGLRISAREAMAGSGLAKTGGKPGLLDRALQQIRFLSRPLLVSLRNTFRRKGRLALTLITLTLGGAIFIGVFSVRTSMLSTLDEALNYWASDVSIYLSRPYRTQMIEQEVLKVPGAAAVECWLSASMTIVHSDDTESASISLIAPPARTRMINPTVLRGRWLLPEDENAVVLNTDALKDEAGIAVGSDIVLKVNSRETTWRVVGVVKGVMTGPVAYANYPYLARLVGAVGRAYSAQVVTAMHEPAFQEQVSKELEAHLKRAGMQVSYRETLGEIRMRVVTQFDILVQFLLIMAIVLAVVGGLGLMGTMSINVLERTREIGVMRAIGASDGAVSRIVIVEGVLIGLISWLIGAVLAYPLSKGLGEVVGVTMLQTPLNFKFSYDGTALWLGVVIALAAVASLLPARRASQLSVREVLAYE